MSITASQVADVLARVRAARPRVHCLMNTVVQKYTADGITAVGGIPSMTSSLDEIEDFTAKVDALAVNLGTLDASRREATRLAAAVMQSRARPWIVDPVHCDYSPLRLEFVRELAALGPSAIRGNQDEMDAIGQTGAILRIETGAIDTLALPGRRVRVGNGHPWLAEVTGTGCLSGGIIAAFMAVEPDQLLAATSALVVIGVAAETAAADSRGPGSFGIGLLDALFHLSETDILRHARIDHEPC